MPGEKEVYDSGKGVDNGGFIKDVLKRDDLSVASFKDRYRHEYLSAKESLARQSEKDASGSGDLDDDSVDLSCGVWKFRTNALGRKFANLYVFTVVVGISMLFTQMVHSVIHVQLTSIERQFKISNAQAGLFDTASKVGHLTTILLAGHFAKKVHIPLVIGLAGMFQGTILMIPAFMQLANPYTLPLLTGSDSGNGSDPHGDNAQFFCRNNDTFFNGSKAVAHHTKEPSDEYTHIAFIVILIVQGVKGVTDAFHSGFLPTLYVDDNMLDKSRMGIFFGIKYVLGELASPVGKQLNAILTEVPVDLKKTEMDPKDQRFIAAWWLAFLLFGAATVLFSFPIILFPRYLVSKRQQQAALQRAMVSLNATDDERTITDKMKVNDTLRKPSIAVIGMKDNISLSERGKRSFTPKSSFNRLSLHSHGSSRKSSLFPPVVGPSERKVSVDGSMAFDQPIKVSRRAGERTTMQTSVKELIRDFPKALVRVFKRPVFLLMLADIAIVSIPTSGISVFRSIYMSSEYNVSMTDVATLTGVTGAVSQVIGTLSSGWLASRVKTRVGYMWIIFITYIIAICITPWYVILGCDNQPVYGHDGRFGMPANMTDLCGCGPVKQLISCGSDGRNYLTPCHAGCEDSIGKTFTNCTGIADATMTLVPGLCPTPCKKNFYLYIALHAIQGMIGGMASIPRRLLILRIVDPRDRAFATSLFAFFGTILGLPSPNLFGRVIDDACLVKDGNVCTLYDRDKIRYIISGVDVGVNIVIQITFVLMLLVFKWEEKKQKREAENKNNDSGDKEVEKRT
ncbi:hypothetical protein BsWGS_23894 [Bradybaena similaris]